LPQLVESVVDMPSFENKRGGFGMTARHKDESQAERDEALITFRHF